MGINKIAPDTSQKIMLLLTVFFWIVSFIFYSPEQTKAFLDAVYLRNITPAYDAPSIIPLLLFIWIIIGVIDATCIHLKVISDIAMAEGADTCESCVGGKLHYSGDWGWLRVGGTKTFPIEGGAVWIGLLTHIHKIGTHVVFEGQMIPKTALDYVPFEAKREIRQRRGGLFGVETCSVGYISGKELATHKEFGTAEYKEFYASDEKVPKTLNTAEFINEIAIKNRTVDMGLQLIEHEHSSLTKSLKTIRDVGQSVQSEKSKGFWTRIFGDN